MGHADTKYQNMPKEYICTNCSTTISAPMHCGHPMHLEDVGDNVQKWVCWMGADCGVKDYEKCCSSPSLNPK